MNAVMEKETAYSTDDIGIDGECPICAQNRDPFTGNPRYNAKALAAIAECNAVINGEIPARLYKPYELEAALKELDI